MFIDAIEITKLTEERTTRRVTGELAEIAEANRVPEFAPRSSDAYEYTVLSPMEVF